MSLRTAVAVALQALTAPGGVCQLQELRLSQGLAAAAVSLALLLSGQLEKRGCCAVGTSQSLRKDEQEDTELV